MLSKKNILILTYWDFDDALIQTYTLPYVQIISNQLSNNSSIYLLTLNKTSKKISFQHPKIKILNFRYYPFGTTAIFYYSGMLLYLLYFMTRQNITHIHTWCTPAGLFGYILSILTRQPLIIDSYEPHAEAMVEVGEWRSTSLAFRLLFYFEKKMTHHAKYLISTTDTMIKEYAVKKYHFNPDKNNWFVKPACVNLQLFKPDKAAREQMRKQLHLENKIVGIYIGKFGGIYLENEVFEWLHTAQQYWKDRFAFILLSSYPKEYILQMCHKFNIQPQSIILKFVPHSEVPPYLNAADFAITPVKPVYTKKFCSPIKNGEYWAMGLPVIITKNISVDSEIIQNEDIGYVIKQLNDEEYYLSARIIEQILHQNNRDKIRAVAVRYRNLKDVVYIYNTIYGDW